MKIVIVATAFLLTAACVQFVEGVVANEEDRLAKAKQDKAEYEEGDGLQRIKDKVPKENTMGLILSWIRDEGICLRRGTTAERACYALSDFDIPQDKRAAAAFWFMMPYQRNPELTNKWYERLYNSVAKILLTEEEEEAPILLGKGGGAGTKERYNVIGIGIGDSKTFVKSVITKGQIGPSTTLNAAGSLRDVEGTVDKIIDLILAAYEADLKKGVDLD